MGIFNIQVARVLLYQRPSATTIIGPRRRIKVWACTAGPVPVPLDFCLFLFFSSLQMNLSAWFGRWVERSNLGLDTRYSLGLESNRFVYERGYGVDHSLRNHDGICVGAAGACHICLTIVICGGTTMRAAAFLAEYRLTLLNREIK